MGLVIISSLMIISLFKKNKEIIIKDDYYKGLIESLRDRVLFHSMKSFSYSLENVKFKSTNDTSIVGEEILNDKNVVLYIDEGHCMSCIDEYILRLNTASRESESLNFFILSDGIKLRELLLMKNRLGIKVPIYSLLDKKDLIFFNKMSNKTDYPYYFSLDRHLNISDVFFPEKESSVLDKRYFKTLDKR